MKGNYRQLTESIRDRSNPDNVNLKKAFSNELSELSYSDVLVFVRYAMKGVEPEYTRRSIEAGENTKTHLQKKIAHTSFKFQGSVMTNTHIKGYSDIDLLVIADKFYHWDKVNVNKHLTESALRVKLSKEEIDRLEKETLNPKYEGIGTNDLKSMRLTGEETLSTTYKICDLTKPKSIKIKNQDLNREVDIVFASWYDNVKSIIRNKGDFRGIQIYNKDKHERESDDYPFLSIKRIKERALLTDNRLLKIIRFLKTIKAESDSDIDLSSFDINAICYDIAVSNYQYASITQLIEVAHNQISSICTNQYHSDALISVDSRNYIFRDNSKKLDALRKVMNEIEKIKFDISKTLIYETKSIYR